MAVSLLGLFSWYVCGHCFRDDALEFVPHCVDITEVGGLKFSEVISKAFVNSLHIGFFQRLMVLLVGLGLVALSARSNSTMVTVSDWRKCLTSLKVTWMGCKHKVQGVLASCWFVH